MTPRQRGWYAARSADGVLRTVFVFPESGRAYLLDSDQPTAVTDWHDWMALPGDGHTAAVDPLPDELP